MLEQLINSLDNRGILVIQALIGRRCIELLESENSKPSKAKSADKDDHRSSNILLPNKEILK